MTACTEHEGRLDRKGYGRIRWRGKERFAHRVAWEVAHGPIPDGMTVDHLCFNPACVNVAHLQLLTHVENARRQRSALSNQCRQGHAYTPENTYRPATGRRQCRQCQAAAVRRYRLRKAAS